MHLLSWLSTSAPTPRAWEHHAELGWDMATSQGANVTGPKASYESAAENSCFLLLGLHFLEALLATRVPSNPSTPTSTPTGPLNLNHVGVSISQSSPGPAVVTRCFQIQVWACWPGRDSLLFWPHQKHPDFWARSSSVLGLALTRWTP